MSEMRVMGTVGDTKLIWDKDNDIEVKAAKDMFKKLRKNNFKAFAVKKGGDKGVQIDEFDSDMEKIIMVPPMQGG